MTKGKYTVRSRHVDGSHVVGRYVSYARAVKAIATKCGGLDWTSSTRGVGMYGDVVTISVPADGPAPPPLSDWEPDTRTESERNPPPAPAPEPAVVFGVASDDPPF